MGRLFEFLVNNPLVLLLLVAWVAGMIGNIGKAAKKTRERAERTERRSAPPQPTSRPPSQPAEPGTRSAEEVARQMRRILGLDPEEEQEQPSEPPPRPVPQRAESRRAESPRPGSLGPRPAHEEVGRREIVVAERPPTPVMPTTQERRIPVHVDPHVGDRITGRHSPQSGRVGKHEPSSALGTLGGRVAGPVRARRMSQRYALDDITKALVLNEILGKPLALRQLDDRLV